MVLQICAIKNFFPQYNFRNLTEYLDQLKMSSVLSVRKQDGSSIVSKSQISEIKEHKYRQFDSRVMSSIGNNYGRFVVIIKKSILKTLIFPRSHTEMCPLPWEMGGRNFWIRPLGLTLHDTLARPSIVIFWCTAGYIHLLGRKNRLIKTLLILQLSFHYELPFILSTLGLS